MICKIFDKASLFARLPRKATSQQMTEGLSEIRLRAGHIGRSDGGDFGIDLDGKQSHPSHPRRNAKTGSSNARAQIDDQIARLGRGTCSQQDRIGTRAMMSLLGLQ